MVILNFAHAITKAQQTQIKEMLQIRIEKNTHNTHAYPTSRSPRTADCGDRRTAPTEWQTQPLLINPPGFAPAAFVLLAILHGYIGHFPALIRLRPTQNPITSYEVAEILNLQSVRERERARTRRQP